MTTLKEDLCNNLQELNADQFRRFKWLLKLEDIPECRLENTEREDIVDIIVQKYCDSDALRVTLTILGKLDRNDLKQKLEASGSGLTDLKKDSGSQKEEQNQKEVKVDLKRLLKFAVEVTLDPDTAHPHLILSNDRKQVYHSDRKKNLPSNSKRFEKRVNILGKESFSSGRFYFEVEMKGKTAWALGVAKESIKRKADITASPKNGYWTIMLTNGDEYEANDGDPVRLTVNKLEKVGVFVDYEESLVSFYDVESTVHLYSFTECNFTEKLYPFLTPFMNDDGKNSAPLIITPLKLKKRDSVDPKEEGKRKMSKLKSAQQFAVDVTLDPDTAHPALLLSDDGKSVYCTEKCKKLPDTSKRFSNCVNVLGKQSFSSGKFYFEVQVKKKTAWSIGVANESIDRKGSITLRPKYGFWTLSLSNETNYKANDDPSVPLSMKAPLQRVGVFVDYEADEVSFYNVDTADLLYTFTNCSFTENLYPYFSPRTSDDGENSAPLIIPSLGHIFRKTFELKKLQQFAVEVILDPDTAHPALILSEDGKQVYDSDELQKLPYNPRRFKKCVNVLGKQGFSSGKFYYEVQVKGKTEWTIGVAKESINTKGDITLNPEEGFWTICLRNGNEYKAVDDSVVHLSVSLLQKVGVFVDYDAGVVSFYDVESADLLYSFTDCSFTEELYPYFSPRTNEGGKNSAPLIISSLDEILAHNSDILEEYEKKRAELKRVQEFEVEVTLDPDTAHPALVLSDDGKRVHCTNVYKKLPDNPKRFDKCVDVLGKQSFSSGRHYFEVQVKRKTAWSVGLASESINRKGTVTLSPEDGFWTIRLRDKDDYKAIDDPPERLTVRSHLQRVGVFVEYEKGIVSFYDVDSADLLYSFTDCSFSEKLYPFFSPSTIEGGINSAPLIISPVNQKEDDERKKAELKNLQQFAVEVTLDPDTANPYLILSDDGKQVHDSDKKRKLPDNPKRFEKGILVLGKQSFTSGRFYYEVQVKGKTAWILGVATESIGRKEKITLSPEDGYWTIWLKNRKEYTANDDSPVRLSLNQQPRKVAIFGDYEKGIISFYDADSAELLYSYTGCSFSEKLYPLFSPSDNDNGKNAAPLIISPMDGQTSSKTPDSRDQKQRKKAELKNLQQFAVEVTLDPDTANPYLILSDDGRQVYDSDVRKKLPDIPKRFDKCVDVLGQQSFSSGSHYYEVQVKGKTAWSLGVASESVNRKGKITLSPEDGFWTIWLRNKNEYTANDDRPVRLSLKQQLKKVGIFVDYEKGVVSFHDADSADLLYSYTDCSFSEKLYPFFSPSSNDHGKNSAPLIISPVNHPTAPAAGDKKEDDEQKKAELKSVQQFAVEVTLDPDTADPYLVLSDDGKQVHHSDVKQQLPYNPKRFEGSFNVLGKQSFSSGRFYYEVQVQGKTDWTIGVAKESTVRKGNTTLSPEDGFWTIWLRNEDEYEAIDYPSVHLSVKSHLQKVGVFVDYEKGVISFYDVDSEDLLYSFTDCSFGENLYPFFNPCTNDRGKNAAPLIISPVDCPTKTQDNQKKDDERKKAELKSAQQFAVEVTLDPDTTHPHLILSDDKKQVYHGDVRQKLPYNIKRFRRCVNVLGKETFSSGKFYFEVQVKDKTAWTVGVAKESIDRKGDITLNPEKGFWTMWLRNGDEYEAIDDPSVDLSVESPLKNVGVFVDYEEGRVSFYDADAADLLYTFTDCSFSEKLVPYFSPCTNDKGINSAPLIIRPVKPTE